uniref:Uncharacterized protein n=1 Tax=Rhizophora mucronata TaxID=61149 RepID=A0A2P2QKU5_RHIMU
MDFFVLSYFQSANGARVVLKLLFAGMPSL